MIYLIETTYYDKKNKKIIDLLKIGYTEDSRSKLRFTEYKLHNPLHEVLYEIPALDEDIEKRIQYKFKDLLYPHYGKEWFWFDQSIVDFFEGIGDVDLESLPKKPSSDKKEFIIKFKELQDIISYVLNLPKKSEEVKNYCDKVLEECGDLLCRDRVIEYLKNDSSITSEMIQRYLDIERVRESGIYSEDQVISKEVSEAINEFNKYKFFTDKIKILCNIQSSEKSIELILEQVPVEYRIYYLALGPEKIKSLSYQKSRLEKEYKLTTVSLIGRKLKEEIYNTFKEGSRISLADIKNTLKYLYKNLEIDSTPKASDINKYFETKEVFVPDPIIPGKRGKGYKLIKKKDQC